MKKLSPPAVLLVFMLLGAPAFADQLTLKDGRQYSGKFIRADAGILEFRIFGKIETFRTSEVAQIVFQEPELVSPPSRREAPPAPRPEPTPDAPIPAVAPSAAGSAASAPSSPVTFPEGTDIVIRTVTPIDSSRKGVDSTFDAVLDEPLTLNEQEIVPRGAPVKGRIAYAKDSGRLSGQSMLILELIEIKVEDRSYPLRTSDYSQVGSSRGKQTAATVGGGAAVGAVIGAVVGGGKGAAIGAATGAAVGTGVQVVTGGETIQVPVETLLRFTLQGSLTVEPR